MKRGIDTNVLIYAHLPSFEIHSQVHQFLRRQLQDPAITLTVTPGILHEFIHVVTDGRRFENPLRMEEASALMQRYLGRSNISCEVVDERCFQEALRLLQRHRLGRKRIADTLFAATLLRNDVHEIITCNPKDFEIFQGLATIDPSA